MNLQTIQVSTTFENTSKMKKFFTIFIPLCVITVSCVILSTRESNYLFGKKAEVKKPRQQSFEEIFAPKKEVINSLARTFKYQPDYDWCVKRGSFDESSPSGLLFVKVPKTASSTISGLVERIARKYGKHGKCLVKDEHKDRYLFHGRDKEKSFMCGSIRDPTSRALSRVFFTNVSRRHKEPTDENVIEWLHDHSSQMGSVSNGQGGFQLNYMSMHGIHKHSAYKVVDDEKVLNYESIELYVKGIMDDYDFVILNERLDESLVVMAILLDLSLGDILYLPSKVSGGFYKTSHGCTKMTKSFVTPAVSKYLSSKEWHQEIYGDVLLHSIINKSLDLTIEMIGKEKFEQQYNEYKRLKNLADELCSPTAIFPCSANGVNQVKQSRENCYNKDWGCGYPCLDQLVHNETKKNILNIKK